MWQKMADNQTFLTIRSIYTASLYWLYVVYKLHHFLTHSTTSDNQEQQQQQQQQQHGQGRESETFMVSKTEKATASIGRLLVTCLLARDRRDNLLLCSSRKNGIFQVECVLCAVLRGRRKRRRRRAQKVWTVGKVRVQSTCVRISCWSNVRLFAQTLLRCTYLHRVVPYIAWWERRV